MNTRGAKVSSSTYTQELGVMMGIFEYAVDLGYMLNNPARRIKRTKLVHKPKTIPTREQFRKRIETIRKSDGRAHSQALAKTGSDLVELLAYSGCRLKEATSLRWRDVAFDQNTLTITGGEAGTKKRERRTIPMNGALVDLLPSLKSEQQPQPDSAIATIDNAKKCIVTSCRRLAYPPFTHHDFRHFFATTCIEAGVDVPTVSRWLGTRTVELWLCASMVTYDKNIAS